MKRIVNRLVKALQEKQLTLALGESMTCGLAAHQLCTVKGTSDVLKGSIVCYDPKAKIELVKIPASLIKRYSAESSQVTEAFVKKLSSLLTADIHVAITGLAAPSVNGSESKDKPVGTVFIAIYYKNKLHSYRKLFRGNAIEIRKKACNEVYELILNTIKE